MTESAPKPLAGRTVEGPISARMRIDGRPYLNFFGAGYLALAGVPEIRAAVRRALDEGVPIAQQLPAAHGANDPIFDELERAAAQACGSEASLYFASGYLIGGVGLAALEGTFDRIIIDESAHYSLRDAARASANPSAKFAHGNPSSLAETLKACLRANERPLVLTDGAFATTGRVAPLAEYAEILAPYNGRLLIDESHSFGVVGERGRGAAEYCGVEEIATIGATFSKAYCAQGAIITCTKSDARRMRTVPPIGAACAGSPLTAAAALASLDYVSANPSLRRSLESVTGYLRKRLRHMGIDVIESPAPIVTFQLGKQADMLALQKRAFEREIYLHYSTYIGAGPEGVIRCAVFRDHTHEDVDVLVDVLRLC
jgi:8-amino-7-oxononanoate synthase